MKDTATRADVDDDVLLELETLAPPVIRGDTVDAKCTAITVRPFGFDAGGGKTYVKPYWVFSFRVIDDGAPHHGQVLSMFVHYEPRWTYLPRRSKALQIVRVALGKNKIIDAKLRKSWFLGKTFRCQLHQAGDALSSGTVIKTITERIGG